MTLHMHPYVIHMYSYEGHEYSYGSLSTHLSILSLRRSTQGVMGVWKSELLILNLSLSDPGVTIPVSSSLQGIISDDVVSLSFVMTRE